MDAPAPAERQFGPRPDPVFAPPERAWTTISPKHATTEMISVPLGWALFVIASMVSAIIWAPTWAVVGAGIAWAVFLGWRVWAVRRGARSWGYAQNETDLYVTHGVLFRELSIIPYGRMQVVEVNSGPLQRKFGLATLTMTTASSAGQISLPGLVASEAARLRDELSRLGESQAAGL